MKATISIVLIILLFSQCLFKLGTLAYFTINQRYIAEVLCVNKGNANSGCAGKCFLNKKLALAEEDKDKSTPASNVKFEIQVFIPTTNAHVLGINAQNKSIQIFYLDSAESKFESFLFRPPTFCA